MKPPRVDLTGRTFGRLRVVERIPHASGRKSVWRCVCECGRTTDVRVDHLLSGHARSCGCLSHERLKQPRPGMRRNLRGRQLGDLHVQRPGHYLPGPHGTTITAWICRCACGREVVLATRDLLSAKGTDDQLRVRPLEAGGCGLCRHAAIRTRACAAASGVTRYGRAGRAQ
ncbi:MAG: hypothetical protein M3541_00300 [Acidobacteriota bacterium]|nr:hypothetical protein [Acidobacteriota bacterium]MDQ3417224.1 hypothetical protein [Acidobacteriota bacterium]